MQKVNITLSFEDEKLSALEIFLKKENSSVQKRMNESLQQLYESAVPEAVREFLDCKAAAAARDRSRRPAAKPAPASIMARRASRRDIFLLSILELY